MVPPPPPPPFCLPFGSKKSRPLSPSRTFSEKTHPSRRSYSTRDSPRSGRSRSLPRTGDDDSYLSGSYSPTATITSKGENLTFKTDSESYEHLPSARTSSPPPQQPRKRGWGYGWGLGKAREKETQKDTPKGIQKEAGMSEVKGTKLLSRKNTTSTQASLPYVPESTNISDLSVVSPMGRPVRPPLTPITDASPRTSSSSSRPTVPPKRSSTQRSKESSRSGASKQSGAVGASRFSPRRPNLSPADSQSTLVGSALERKMNDVDEPKEKVVTTQRLEELRTLMLKETLDYYVIPSEDAHGSEYVAACDKRRQFISGFTGSAGQAIVSKGNAYLITDSRYWLQAEEELDSNWTLIRVPLVENFKDWQSFLLSRIGEGSRIGLDARMVSWAKASALNSAVQRLGAKLVFPTQNLIDLVWKSKPARSKEPVFVHSRRFAGQDASAKLDSIRRWIAAQPPAKPGYSKPGPPTDAQKHVATLITGLSNVAWTLNLRGHDVPYNPVFQAYLFVSLESAVLFVELAKLTDDVRNHLSALHVEPREYNNLWSFLRRASWGPGKVLIADDASYAISLLLTHFRYTIVPSPSFVDERKAIKNEIEIEGLRSAYLRDGASYVRWLAWLEDKLAKGYQVTEYEAAQRLTEYRRKNDHFEGLAYENISATGPNAALPHYSPTKSA
ncbi:Creatinase/Prolidase N-terminal domain-containing protein, partial [Phellopilus nigrolimitatus]